MPINIIMFDKAIAYFVPNLKNNITIGTFIAPPPIPATLHNPISTARITNPASSKGNDGNTGLWVHDPAEHTK